MESNHNTIKSNFDLELNTVEGYEKVGEIYKSSTNKVESVVNDYFFNLENAQESILRECMEFTKIKYQEIIQNFEDSVKGLNEDIEKVDRTNELEVKRFKRRYDDTVTLINSRKDIDGQFAEIFSKIEQKLKYLSMSQLQNPEVKLNLTGKNGKLEWKGTQSSFLNTSDNNNLGNSYKVYVSEETFEDVLTCKIRISKINTAYANSFWSYCIGLINDGFETNVNNYYNYSVLLHSNGSLNIKFSGSCDNSGTKTKVWEQDDSITVTRSLNNEVFFSVNNEEKVSCFQEISGPKKLILAVSSSSIDDEFELIECGKFD